jgi:hypothetical protein
MKTFGEIQVAKTFLVEYLVIVKQADTFCNNEATFLRLLEVDTSINIEKEKGQIIFKAQKYQLVVAFQLETAVVPGKSERFFKLRLSMDSEKKLGKFEHLTKVLENIFNKMQKEVSVNVLWNDIGKEYAVEGYRLINEVENLIRRLISSFMLINVGYEWPKFHIPPCVEQRDQALKTTYSDFLHQTYFSDLRTILFEGQRELGFRKIGEIQRFVEKVMAEKQKTIKVDDLKGVISKSLWERHFAKTNYSKKDFENDLKALNELRNEIAHCRNISRETLGKVENLSKKIIKTLKLEIEKLPEKKLSEKERKFQIANEMARYSISSNKFYGSFLAWAIENFYKSKFGKDKVSFYSNNLPENVFDLVAKTENDKIGVQVNSVSIGQFTKIVNGICNEIDSEKYIPKDLLNFSEFHLVIVLRDSDSKAAIFPLMGRLESYFQSKSKKLKLIIGMINSKRGFEEFTFEEALYFYDQKNGF